MSNEVREREGWREGGGRERGLEASLCQAL